MRRTGRFFPHSWRKELYLSQRDVSGERNHLGDVIEGYGDPIKLQLNYQPLSAESDIREFGESSRSVQKAVIKRGEKGYGMFNEFDLVYLDGASPDKKPHWEKKNVDKEPSNGDWANYRVAAIKTFNLTQHVYFIKTKKSGVL